MAVITSEVDQTVPYVRTEEFGRKLSEISSMLSDQALTDVSPHKLTQTNAPAFLEKLKRSGSIRGSARALAIDRQTCYELRYQDAEFRNAWDVIRLRHTGDELMFALDALISLGTGWEGAVDELVNVAFLPDEAPLGHRGISPESLAAARKRLDTAGRAWAAAVTAATTSARVA